MVMLLSRTAWAKFPAFLAQKVIISAFLAQIRNQHLKIDPCAKFSHIGQKIREARILTWNNTENCLMTSYLPHSDDVSKIIIDFERFCSRVPSCEVWW